MEDWEQNKVFCEKCRKDVPFNVSDIELKGIIKGTEYRYMGKEARCDYCGSEVYIPEINDSNLKKLYDKYREANGIVSFETILAIPEKYGIGKRPLSLLLGWGEQTFSRYYEGDVPSKHHSDILQKIYDDPTFYNKILEENKKNITESSYT